MEIENVNNSGQDGPEIDIYGRIWLGLEM